MTKPSTLTIDEGAWHKSTLSTDTNCVEVAFSDGYIAVRDSKNKDKQPLIFTKDEWRAFTGGVAQHEFDITE